MYDPLPLWNEDAAPKQLPRAFMVNALYFDGVSAVVGGVPDPRPTAALPSKENDVLTCDSIEFLDKAGVPVALCDPDLVEELGEDIMSRKVGYSHFSAYSILEDYLQASGTCSQRACCKYGAKNC